MIEVKQAVFACIYVEGDNIWLHGEDVEWLVNLYGESVYSIDLWELINDV